MDLSCHNLFVTGGAGTLGRAIAARRKKEGWKGKLTVYSTDEHKHAYMRKLFPDVNFICGDIRNPETLYNAIVGHDLVIHAGAVKVIPTSEYDCLDTYDVNVNGSLCVLSTCVRAGIQDVILISTDKACHPANAYGCTKMMMEKLTQEYARIFATLIPATRFHLVRYGNVLESTGSVVEAWKKAVDAGQPIKITNPKMTRFWLSPSQAVDLVLKALDLESGHIYVAKMPALSIEKLAEYILDSLNYKHEIIPMRPGEKMHETLLTAEETDYALDLGDYFDLRPSTETRNSVHYIAPYSSDVAPHLSAQALEELLYGEK